MQYFGPGIGFSRYHRGGSSGFCAEVDKNSAGSFETDFPVAMEAGAYRSGQGEGAYSLRVNSGSIHLYKQG